MLTDFTFASGLRDGNALAYCSKSPLLRPARLGYIERNSAGRSCMWERRPSIGHAGVCVSGLQTMCDRTTAQGRTRLRNVCIGTRTS